MLPRLISAAPKLRETYDRYIVEGKEFRLVISKDDGLIVRGYFREVPVITGGPYLHMTGLDLEPWELESMEIQELPGCVQVGLQGGYGPVGRPFHHPHR